MREILFRGKPDREYLDDKFFKDSDWVYGNLLVNKQFILSSSYTPYYILPTSIGMNDISIWAYAVRVIPETVGQWTGEEDNNGLRIFEGDIFLLIYDDNIGEVGTVKYDMGAFNCPSDTDYRVEVIGNIHDNPELLEAK